MNLFFGNALWHLIAQSDTMTKIILLLLLVVSITCWSLIFFKWTAYNQKEKEIRNTLTKIRLLTTKQEFLALSVQESHTCTGPLFLVYSQDIQFLLQNNALTLLDKESIDVQKSLLIEEIIFQEEAYLPVLSIASASGPLVGLFGTVWGLTNSFISISQKQSADIVTIAPGMAEALITTLAGLMVAIPMLVMFHYLNGRVRTLDHMLQQLSDQMHIVVQKIFLPKEALHEKQILSKETETRSFVS